MDTRQLLRDAMKSAAPKAEKKATALDAVTAPVPALDSAGDYATKDVELRGVTALHQWVETDDLDDGEGFADRLLALFVGVADENKDGDITEEEQDVIEIALTAAYDYLVTAGVTEADASALLEDWDETAAERVRDFLAGVMPEGDDTAADEVDAFIFTAADQEPALDAAYKKVIAVRKGRKVRIRKRISGTVRLSAKQKVAIRKARMKSHSAKATIRRMKSMTLRKRMGLS
ncbi:MAG TPA: hypothetical protein VIG97_02405 [Luteimonas sp.]